MPQPLKLRQLEHLVFLADELNFARAAERACLSQSAFSRSIQALEALLGMRLCDRDLKFVKLTPAGERTVLRSRRLLSASIDLVRELEMVRLGNLGNVVCGAGPFTATALFPAALARLRQEHPQVDVRLKVDNSRSLLAMLDEEILDFFISDIRELPEHDDVIIQPLGKLAGSLYCRPDHPLHGRADLCLSDIRHAQFASVNMPDVVRSGFSQLLGHTHGTAFNIAFECENIVVARELARRTDLILVACIDAVRYEVETGYLVELPVRELVGMRASTPLRTEIGVVRMRDRTLTPSSELLLKYVVELAPNCLT
jgi:DNA-binding transcriptional LysR family regulator